MMKTAMELGLTDELHAALALVLEKLEAGELRHTEVEDVMSVPEGEWFSMAWWSTDWPKRDGENCGTAACIGGWACKLSGNKWMFDGRHDEESALGRLIYPDTTVFPKYSVITPEMAARGLRNYLEKGEALWGQVARGE